MRIKISVIGKGVKIPEDLARLAEVTDDLRGADVVVLAGDADLGEIARSAPAAALVVTGANPLAERCRAVYEGTLFPPARIVGVADPDRVGHAAEAIAFDSGEAHDVLAMADGEFSDRTVRLGRGGIRELL